MKIKTLRNGLLGIGVFVLAVTLSTGTMNNNQKSHEVKKYASISNTTQISNIIKPMEEMPYGG